MSTNAERLDRLDQMRATSREGGGEARVAKQHEAGKQRRACSDALGRLQHDLEALQPCRILMAIADENPVTGRWRHGGPLATSLLVA